MGKADVFTGMSLTEKLIWLKHIKSGGSWIYSDVTESGNPIIISPTFPQNAKALSVDFSPKKDSAGHDDLSGLSSISVTRTSGSEETSITIPLETDSYKGYVDVLNGTVTITHQKFSTASLPNNAFSSIKAYEDRNLIRGWLYVKFTDACAPLNTSSAIGYCDQLVSEIKPNASTSSRSYANTANIPLIGNTMDYPNSTFFWIPYKTTDGAQEATVAGAKEWFSRKQVHLLLPIKEPTVYHVTPNQLSLLVGRNTIATDEGGTLSLTYQTRTKE